RRGYRFIAPITEESFSQNDIPAFADSRSANDGVYESENHESLAESGSGIRQFAVRRWWWMAVVSALIAAGAGLVALPGHLRNSAESHDEEMKNAGIRRAVAVLDFRNLSGRAEDAWLSTALSQMLSTELAAGDRLRLVPGED